MYNAVDSVFKILYLVIFLRILFTWFPDIDWWKQPFKFLREASDPILEPFRRLIPPIGGMDISPIFAFLAIQVLQTVSLSLIANFM